MTRRRRFDAFSLVWFWLGLTVMAILAIGAYGLAKAVWFA